MLDLEEKADWAAWTVQLIVGLPMGTMAGYLAGSRGRGYHGGQGFFWLENGSAGWFILGCTILGGALMSHYGNRFWDDNGAFGIFPLHEPLQNRTSFTWSCILGAIGTLLIIFALAKHAAAI
jgi:hypothetical protein